MSSSMNEGAPNPKRKRQRWLVIGVLLLIASGTSWWNWPRGDSRFVGTWQIEYQAAQSTGGVLSLYSNGSAYFVLQGNQVTSSFPWWVSDGQLNLGHVETRGPSDPIRLLTKWLYGVTRHHLRPAGEAFEIVEVESHRVILRAVDGDTTTLTRIVE
jgi:hypothetical protein